MKWVGFIIAVPLVGQMLGWLWNLVIVRYILLFASLYELGGTLSILALLAIQLVAGVVILHQSSKGNGEERVQA